MKRLFTIKSGYSEKVPQSFCYDGKRYIIQYSRQYSDTYGRLIAYSKNGKRVKTGSKVKIGF